MPPPSLLPRLPFKSTILIGLLVLCLLSFSFALDSEEGKNEETFVELEQNNEDQAKVYLDGETFGHRNHDDDDDDDEDDEKRRHKHNSDNDDDDDDWEAKWEKIKDTIKDHIDDDDDEKEGKGKGNKDESNDKKNDREPSRKPNNDDDDDDDDFNRPEKNQVPAHNPDNKDEKPSKDNENHLPHDDNNNKDNKNDHTDEHDSHGDSTPVDDQHKPRVEVLKPQEDSEQPHRHHYIVLKGALGCFIIGWFVTFGGLRFYYGSFMTFGVLFFESLLFLMFPLGHSSCAYFVYGLVSLLLSYLILKSQRVCLLIGAFLMAVIIASITTTAIFGPIMSLYVWVIVFVGGVISCCNLAFPKLGLILTSSFVGSFMVVTSFDLLTGNHGGLITAIPELLDGDEWVRGLTWLFIILFYALAAIGFFAQLLFLSRRKGLLFDRVLSSDAPTENAGYDSFDEPKKNSAIPHVTPVGNQAN